MTTARPLAFVLAATRHGPMIVNRFDHAGAEPASRFGVGHQLLGSSEFDPSEVRLAQAILQARRAHFGDGVVAVDAGANIGVHTIEWARLMTGWGRVLAFEAQETVFYALAGNIVLNNCFNARAQLAALGAGTGELPVPQLDPLRPASFGSLELRQRPTNEPIGQAVSYDREQCRPVPLVSIDSLALERLDFIKIDVEGMEAEVLRGARGSILAHRPCMLVEVIKSDRTELRGLLDGWGYTVLEAGINWLAIHPADPFLSQVAPSRAGNSTVSAV